MGDALAEMMKQGSLYSRLLPSLIVSELQNADEIDICTIGCSFLFSFVDGWKGVKRME